MEKKKIKNLRVLDILFVVILLFPVVVPCLHSFFTAIGNSGVTSISFSSNLISDYRSIFSNFNNILGFENFNEWFISNIFNLNFVNVSENVDLFVTFPLVYCEYFLLCYLLKIVIDFVLLLPQIVSGFVSKLGGGSNV